MTAEQTIAALDLMPHPEGGHYRRSYTCEDGLARAALPARYDGERAIATAIYFLLRAGEISCLHRLRADEIWHFYRGETLLIHVIAPDGTYTCHRLGADIAAGERPQIPVAHGCWFGAELAGRSGYTLVGNTVAPGFDFADFTLAESQVLAAEFPQHAALIRRMSAR